MKKDLPLQKNFNMQTSIIRQDETTGVAEFSVIRSKIYEIRGQKVMLDFDLAKMYGTETKVLKQSVKRNIKRFPDDFMFELTRNEWNELVTNCDHMPKSMKHSYVPSFAFTEQGIAMLSGLLNSDIAINTNIVIMRAFVVLRQYALGYAEIKRELDSFKTETKEQIGSIYNVLDELISHKKELEKPRNPIGFKIGRSND